MLIKLLMISLICVFIIDYSGFIQSAEDILTKILRTKFKVHIPKPFSCSLCCTFWTGLILLWSSQSFTLYNILLVVFCASLTIIESEILNLLRDTILIIIEKLRKFFKI